MKLERRRSPAAQQPSPGLVTALREHPRRAGRYTIEIGGGAVGPLSVELIAELGLAVGRECDASALARLVAGARRVECYDRALAALARRSRSSRDLEQWLAARDFIAPDIAAAVERLTALGLLDDLAFARGFAHARAVRRGWGLRRVAAELARHGVARSTLDLVMGELREQMGGSEAEAVEAAARKRAGGLAGLEPEVARRRLLGWLLRRGFASPDATAAVRKLLPRTAGAPRPARTNFR